MSKDSGASLSGVAEVKLPSSSSSQPAAGPDPAAGHPLRLVLRLVHHRQQLHARVLQLLVHHHVIEELPVLSLHLLSRCLHLLEVFFLRVEARIKYSHPTAPLDRRGALYPEGPVGIVAGGHGGGPSGLPEALRRWRLHVDDVGLQLGGPHRLDGLTHPEARVTSNRLQPFTAVHRKRVTTATAALRLRLARCQRGRSSRCSKHPSPPGCLCRTGSPGTRRVPGTCGEAV